MTSISSTSRNVDRFPNALIAQKGFPEDFSPKQMKRYPPTLGRIFVPHGETLLSQGAASTSVFYILNGWALEEQLTCDGEIAWAYVTMRGEVAGINSVSFEARCDGQIAPVSTAFIHALTDVFALSIPRDKFLAGAEDDCVFGPVIRDILRRQVASQHSHFVALSAKLASDRILQIVRTLHSRALEQGAISTFGSRLPISQVVMAKFANISVVHLNRIAQKLRHDGHLDWNGDGVCVLEGCPHDEGDSHPF
jgi:CRP-like cAMP-binding protein